MQMAHKLLSTRSGTIAISAAAAALAAAILIGYLHQYRQSVDQASRPMPVLIARDLIEQGTPGSVVGAQELFQVTTVPRDELTEGAISDPAILKGQIATEDIYPGAQLAASAFAAGTDAVSTKVAAYERGMSVPLDEAHGMIGQIAAGDHVDVIAAFKTDGSDGADGKAEPVAFVLAQEVLVLDAPAQSATAGLAAGAAVAKSVVLRLTDEESAELAYAVENGVIWLVVRPTANASEHVRTKVTLERLLLGVRPIPMADNDGSAPRSGERR